MFLRAALPRARRDLDTLKKPYILMGELLKAAAARHRLNLCQYGMGDVWKWGGEVGGQSWRTGGDLGVRADRFFEVALQNAEHTRVLQARLLERSRLPIRSATSASGDGQSRSRVR